MTHDMNHNDMKGNNGMRDTMSATRGRHGSGGFAIRQQRMILTQGNSPLVRADEITAHSPRHYGSLPTTLRLVIAQLLMVTLGVGTTWGQTDYTGVYYIANKIWNGDNTSSPYYLYSTDTPSYNWYLVPAADPQLDHYSDAYFNAQYKNTNSSGTADYTGDNYGDSEKPFLTTFRTNRDNNSIWIFKKTGDYYYIIHALKGKYIKYEPPYKSFSARKTMHLEDVDTETPGDEFKFLITENPGSSDGISGFNIAPKNKSEYYFNPAGDNWPRYYGTNDGNKTPYSSGMVGLWNGVADLTKGSLWPHENALLPAPTISAVAVATSKVSVTNVNGWLPEGYNIRYTVSTDGSAPADPTVSSSTMDADGYTVTEKCIIKAVIERYGVVLTAVATSGILYPANVDAPTITVNCDNTVSLSCGNVPDADIRYTVNGTDPTSDNGTLYNGDPITLAPGDELRAIAYHSKLSSTVSSSVSNHTHAIVHTAAPTITYTSSAITITGSSTIYYTTTGVDPTTSDQSGSSPVEISYDGVSEVDVRAIAKDGLLESSCVTRLVTLTAPTATVANDDCSEDSPRANMLTVTGTDDGRTFWFAVTAGSGSAAPDPATMPNPYHQYTLGTPVSIDAYANASNSQCTVHVYAMNASGARSSIVSVNHNLKTSGKPALSEPTGSSTILGISGGEADGKAVCSLNGTENIVTLSAQGDAEYEIPNADGTITVCFKHGEWQSSCEATYTIPGAPATPTASQTPDNKLELSCATEMAEIYYTITTDGSEPEAPTRESATYTAGCLYDIPAGARVKAIAYLGFRASGVLTYTYYPENPDAPKFFVDGNLVRISTDTEGAIIYYERSSATDGTTPAAPADPTTSSSSYSSDLTLAPNEISVFKAYAVKDGHASVIVTAVTREGYSINNVTRLNTIAGDPDKRDKYWFITADFSAAGYNGCENFSGVLVGNNHTISNLSKPLFNTLSGSNAVVHSLNLKSVTIDENSGNAGAIAKTASGAARIYNCGILPDNAEGNNTSSVSGTAYVGGLVGELAGSARVINCFSYATVSGGTHRGGIVGYNSISNSTSGNLQTMVMNCMFYGNISTTGSYTQIAPIYGGYIIHNKRAADNNTGLNNYCYFYYDADKNPYVNSITTYNGALGAEERYLNRFEFFRLTLNSTRNMAAYYVTNSAANPNEHIAKWVLDKSIAPYPILKPQGYYPSVVNPDADHAAAIDADNKHRNKGRKLGTVTVHIEMGTGGAQFNNASATLKTSSITRNITDKDFDNYNFNYKKIQLPYYNEVGNGNYTNDRVVTGWKIVSVNHSGTGSFTTATYDYPDYNFVDRTCTDKDLYSESQRVFNQGAYWEVPDGVTSITIQPYWAKAVYLSDANYDVTYSGNSKYGVTVAGSCSTTVNQTVYTSVTDAMTALSSNTDDTVYDYAVVLVGNYHQSSDNAIVNDGKPVTFMSADLDGDREPDNTLFYYHKARRSVSPIRFDFLNMPGIGMTKRTWDANTDPEPGIFKPKGWFEITNTVFVRFGQFEYAESAGDFPKASSAPLILQGGIYEQFVSAMQSNSNNTTYIHVGGNSWFKNFANGCHTNTFRKTPKVPINVTGGDYTNFYLTGIYQPSGTEDAGNAACYIDGGRFVEVAGAGMQVVNGNVTWLINGADITSFYGGGINAAQPLTGNISTTISNSYVEDFYGGPKFGDMYEDKTVTTTAKDCHFGKFYGAGYGGTAFNKVIPSSAYDSSTTGDTRDWDTWVNDQYKRAYSSGNNGISTSYDYEFILHSDGNQTVARFYVNYASLSLASTRNVETNLNGCEIGTFYGGGRLGAVKGNVNSTLTDCHVTGNAFGAGFSAEVPTVEVWDIAGMKPVPTYDRKANVFNNASVKFPNEQEPKKSVVYTWSDKGSNTNPFTDEGGKHYIHTDEPLNGLGAVTGNATITLNGKTSIDGNLYGGGDASDIQGTTLVEMTNGVVNGNVFGGGRGEADNFKCDKAMVGEEDDGLANPEGGTTVSISNGKVKGNVYGGGEVGRVEKNTVVTIGLASGSSAPVIEGSVYGAGKGVATHGYSALVRGNTEVTIQGKAKVGESVYGGGEIASVGRYGLDTHKMPSILLGGGECEIKIQGATTIGSIVAGNVFGACKGVDARFDKTNEDKSKRSRRMTVYNDTDFPEADKGTKWEYYDENVTPKLVWEYFQDEDAYNNYLETLALATAPDVTIDGSAIVNGSVYGGGQRGITKGSVVVTVNGGTINKDVYGGGALANTNIARVVGKKDSNGKPIKIGDDYDTEAISPLPSTTVNLLGGYIKGDAYGGGLGQLTGFNSATGGIATEDIAAVVDGDINVTLNGTKFDITYDNAGTNENPVPVVKSGRVFGCNNLLGSPTGNVTVTVQKTVAGNTSKTLEEKKNSVTESDHTYELAAVYGGGNLASFETTGKKAHVIIHGCDNTSIQTVYGGGNAAPVPETGVDIYSAYEIGNVFGGGNGKDKYKKGDSWETNPGANVGFKDGETPAVGGDANTMIYGGTVHEAYGGSNKKGTIYGNVSIDVGSADQNEDGCTLNVGKIVGAGKDADVDGDITMVMRCKPNTKVPLLYAGADNANVNGKVELTITSGNFGKVFGGNNQGGFILGHIMLNIEETGNCDVPITIDELYLGGNEAAYSMYGYYNAGTDANPDYQPRTAEMADPTNDEYKPDITTISDMTVRRRPDATTHSYAQPVLNIISCTSIGQVFGGGLGERATIYGNPIVNINMIPGDGSHKIKRSGSENVHDLGTIGDVFGGGNQAAVYGNTTVNIGTATRVRMTSIKDVDEDGDIDADDDVIRPERYSIEEGIIYGIVEGAYITGNVYGGGNLADVGKYDLANDHVDIVGNTNVNIGAVETKTPVFDNNNQPTGEYVYVYTAVDLGATPENGYEGVTIKGHVFGGGAGVADETTFTCEKAIVTGETNVRIGNGTVKYTIDNSGNVIGGNVYGGGEVGRVETDTHVTIGFGNGTGSPTSAPVVEGYVFGAGAGKETHGYSALVRGNSTVIIEGNANVEKNVYGGGEKATVGRYWVKGVNNIDSNGDPVPGAPVPPSSLAIGMPYKQQSGGDCTVTVRGKAQVGQNGGATGTVGHVFGAGKGVGADLYGNWAYDENDKTKMPYRITTDPGAGKRPDAKLYDDLGNGLIKQYYPTKAAYFKFLETLALVSVPNVSIDGSAKVKGNVYGGSESGFVQDNTFVTIQGTSVIGTTTYGHVFGGGKGLEDFAEAGKVKGNTNVSIYAGTVKGNVYGGGELGDVGTIDKTDKKDGQLTYNYKWKQSVGNEANTEHNNTISSPNNNTGICKVYITGGTIGISETISSEHGNVFGAGRGSKETWWCEKAIVYSTDVQISAGTIHGTVYGGGEIGRVEDDAKVWIGIAGEDTGSGKPDIKSDVFGAGAGLETHGYSALLRGNTDVIVQGVAQVGGSVYGGGETASVGKFTVVGGLPTEPNGGGNCTVTIRGYAKIGSSGTENHVFGACKGVTPTTYDITNYKNYKSMQTVANGAIGEEHTDWDYYPSDKRFVWKYYRSEEAYHEFLHTLALTSDTNVSIEGSSSVYGSVYGGGQRGITLGKVDVAITGGTIYQDVYGGGALADTNKGNWSTNKYVVATVTPGETIVTGMYTKSGTESSPIYTEITAENTKAVLGTQYFIKGAWTDPEKQTTLYTTTVKLTGGLIKGDAYGGGLGRLEGTGVSAVEAKVYGDINLSLGGTAAAASSSATAFDITSYTDDHADVVKSGRVFGCNNLLGSPQGNVTVTVWKTVSLDAEGVVKAKPIKENNIYEVAAVYGGGNLAPFTTTGKKAHVIIHGCSDTSILTVYGGGNAAPVPETDVDIHSCYEIGSVFGGGNGKDEYTLNGGSTWNTNPGANVGFKDGENPPVGGNVNTMIYGGTVHEAYGGSNKKGTIYGNVSIDVGSESQNTDHCTLNVGKIVGAGKDADIEGDLKIIMGCKPDETIAFVYGGADNANINGNVELTVTSGHFGKIFGGNNRGGIIKGHIKLNIEETGKCAIPIKIDELYLGGNEAMYSMYGYYKVGDVYKARESADDSHPAEEGIHPVPYDAPELNIISCTHIGKVFGGGLGETAAMYADPTVNINMIPGDSSFKIDRDGSTGSDNDYHALGEIVDVYGGGNEATVYGNTTVNIGTATEVTMISVNDLAQAQEFANGTSAYSRYKVKEDDTNIYGIVEGAFITGNVYGGGKQADVTGNTYVNICAYKDDDNTTADVIEYKGVSISGTNFKGVTIKGNVFGGGEGVTEAAGVTGAFECAKAMVGNNGDNDTEKNEEAGIDIMKESTDRGTRVSIGNGTVEGTVYGGGEVGRVEWNGVVTIGLPVGSGETSAPEIKGDVFGGGKGVEQYGYAALMRGNTFVTVQANAKVGKSVYGGGEIASVGKYKVAQQEDIDNPVFMAAHPGIEKGMPYSLGNEKSGYCNVIVRGNAEIGPDNMRMHYDDVNKAADDDGHVFGAGKGVLPYENEDDFKCQKEGHDGAKHPGRMGPGNAWDCYDGNEPAYLRFIETQALVTHTEVLVGGNAFVKGSVYGGSLSGHVQHDTHVTIAGDCQIGAGDGINERYTDHYGAWPTDTKDIGVSWKECAHWPYIPNNDMPYDPYAKYLYNGEYYYDADHQLSSNGGSYKATDGHTYYGNVFGGGSGVVPYAAGKWHREAGTVGGNTVVDITGGHILTSVYGGNEHTDVGTYDPSTRALVAETGKCTVNMIGGTVGVPRTKEDIAAHPVTCYVFGAGKGDQRTNFNTWTNVGEAQINISGNARIYGSTFGGGEDGHVLGDVETNVGGTVTIGSTDYTYPNPITNEKPGVIIGTQGLSGADGNIFGGGRGFSEEALTAGVVCGNVTVNIHNGKMLGTVFGGGRLASVGTYLVAPEDSNYGKLQPDVSEEPASSHGHISINIAGGTIGATDGDGKLLASTSSIGDVFGGCKGSTNDNPEFGLSKYTVITMTGGMVNGNIYGGGEVGNIKGNTKVDIQGGTIAKNVFGGGKGDENSFTCEKAMVGVNNEGACEEPDSEANKDKGTKVSIRNGIVKGNVYGGGEIARVEWNTQVEIGVGTGEGPFAPTIEGSVFGAGKGLETHGYSALVRGNSTVTVQGKAKVGYNVYGGGEIATVGRYWVKGIPTTKCSDEETTPTAPADLPTGMPYKQRRGGICKVTIQGEAEIGYTGAAKDKGHVFGAGQGVNPNDYVEGESQKMTTDGMVVFADEIDEKTGKIVKTAEELYLEFLQTLSLVTNTYVTIDGSAKVNGNVYGGSESGFVQNDTNIKMLNGTINPENTTNYGNIFGGGLGVEGNEAAGKVKGNTVLDIFGGTINGSVFGGGALSKVVGSTNVNIGEPAK